MYGFFQCFRVLFVKQGNWRDDNLFSVVVRVKFVNMWKVFRKGLVVRQVYLLLVFFIIIRLFFRFLFDCFVSIECFWVGLFLVVYLEISGFRIVWYIGDILQTFGLNEWVRWGGDVAEGSFLRNFCFVSVRGVEILYRWFGFVFWFYFLQFYFWDR